MYDDKNMMARGAEAEESLWEEKHEKGLTKVHIADNESFAKS